MCETITPHEELELDLRDFLELHRLACVHRRDGKFVELFRQMVFQEITAHEALKRFAAIR